MITGLFSYIDYQKKYGARVEAGDIKETQITEAGRTLLGLSGLILTSYPYNGKGMLRLSNKTISDFDNSWLEELTRYNGYLIWLWNGNNLGLNELMNQYSKLEIKHKKDENEKILQQHISQMKDAGIYLNQTEIDDIRNRFHAVIKINYNLIIQDFFSKILQIEQDIIPKVIESRTVMKTYENQYKIKSVSMWISLSTTFVFVVGIIFPIIIGVYAKSSILRIMELAIFSSMLPYLYGLYYLITASLKMP